jgi:hypothetical protein
VDLLKVSLESTVVAAPNQFTADVNGEAVILDVQSAKYFGLEDVGMRIWQLIQQPCKLSTVRDTLLEEYEVEQSLCEQDLLTLVEELHQKGLVEVRGEDNR